jgi:hypothetical protein
MPQMGYDTKTDRLTISRNVTLTGNRHRPFGPVLNQSRPVTTSYQSLVQLRVQRSPAGKRFDYSPNLHEPCRPVQIFAVPHSLQPRLRSSTSNDRRQSAAARSNAQSQLRYDSSTRRHRGSTLPPRITPPPIGSAALQPAMSALRLASHHALQAHRGSSKTPLFRATTHGTDRAGNLRSHHPNRPFSHAQRQQRDRILQR